MILETGKANGQSPWRIKVTVEAEPDDSGHINRTPTRAARQRTRTTTVPLKGLDSSSPVKGSTRTRKPKASTPAAQSQRTRKPTPVRRKRTPAKTAEQTENDADADADADTDFVGPDESLVMTTGKKGRAKSASAVTNLTSTRSQSSEAVGNASESVPPQPKKLLEESIQRSLSQSVDPEMKQQEEAMWRAMASQTDAGESTLLPEGDDADYSLSEDEEDAVLGAAAAGDATMLESEEFSMISVDSLTSHRNGTSSPTQAEHLTSGQSARKIDHSIAFGDVSYMPSSPPVMHQRHETPAFADLPTTCPEPPTPSFLHHDRVSTSLRNIAVKSGMALQSVVQSPDRSSQKLQQTPAPTSIFAAFGSGTRRKLQASLNVGQQLASPLLDSGSAKQETPDEKTDADRSSASGHLKVPERTQIAHRLPTPEEPDHSLRSQTKALRSSGSGNVQHPSLKSQVQEVQLQSPKSPYDAMSWAPTGPLKSSSPRANISLTDKSATGSASAPTSRDLVSISSDGSESSELDDDQDEEEDRDIWQEEASRSLEEDDDEAVASTEAEHIFQDDLPIKPRRSKLPGTWRRASAHHFHYSDSPEPELLQTHKASGSTAKTLQSGVMTPSTTEEEDGVAEDEGAAASRSANATGAAVHGLGIENQDSGDDALSPFSESSGDTISPDGDDTGLFWQSNMPAVYTRRERPALRQNKLDSGILAGLKRDMPESSPFKPQFENSLLGHTRLEDSPAKAQEARHSPLRMHPLEGKIKTTANASSSSISTPLRNSLLKSSKVRLNPLAKSTSAASETSRSVYGEMASYDLSEYSHNSSMASDARQLMSEMVEHQRRMSMHVDSSMASDARQLMNEMAEHQRRASLHTAVTTDDDGSDAVYTPPAEDSEGDISRSYEERLNHASPIRIAVKFDDSTLCSSVLAPKKAYPPLFENVPSLQPTGRDVETDTSIAPSEANTSIFSKLTSFWSAAAPPNPAPSSHLSAAESTTSQTTGIPDTTLRLRRKYGLLPSAHPFTYAHIRTFHRMLNSSRYSPGTCIIPSSGLLPTELESLVGQTRTNSQGQSFTWDAASAHVVAAFMSLLLPVKEIARLQEMGQWGDREAIRHRGFDSKGRHGDYMVFPKKMEGRIESVWVARLLVDIIWREGRAEMVR